MNDVIIMVYFDQRRWKSFTAGGAGQGRGGLMHVRLQGEATKCLKTRLCGESHAVLRHFGAFLGHLCAFSGCLCPKLIVSGCHVRPFSVLDFFGRHPHMGEGVQYLEEGGLQHPQHP